MTLSLEVSPMNVMWEQQCYVRNNNLMCACRNVPKYEVASSCSKTVEKYSEFEKGCAGIYEYMSNGSKSKTVDKYSEFSSNLDAREKGARNVAM